MPDRFNSMLLSRHARREAHRERIPLAMIEAAYEAPDMVRASDHDELREIRARWFGEEGVEVVADTDDGRVVTVGRKGTRQ